MGSRLPRGSLSRHVVLDTALALVDRVGLDRLTIRGLARELGRPPMTLYAHFESRSQLLDLMFERVVHRIFAGHHQSTWEAEFAAACRHLRRLLLDHPHWIALLTRVEVPRYGLETYERLLGLMWADGFRPEAAMFAFSAIVSHAIGAVLVERLMAGEPPIPKQRLELVKGILAEMPRGPYRRVAAVAHKFDAWTFEDVFEVGLRSLLAGLAESAPRRHARRRPA
jgi:AcrR family transcriptional regulator